MLTRNAGGKQEYVPLNAAPGDTSSLTVFSLSDRKRELSGRYSVAEIISSTL
jgi:hypothetical protein